MATIPWRAKGSGVNHVYNHVKKFHEKLLELNFSKNYLQNIEIIQSSEYYLQIFQNINLKPLDEFSIFFFETHKSSLENFQQERGNYWALFSQFFKTFT